MRRQVGWAAGGALPSGAAGRRESCPRRSQRANAPSPLPPAAGTCAPGDAVGSTCSCVQLAWFLLATLGCGLPIAAHFLASTASRRAFLRRHCQRPHCASCATAKGADVPVLAATAALLLAGYCAAVWQLIRAAVHSGSGVCQ